MLHSPPQNLEEVITLIEEVYMIYGRWDLLLFLLSHRQKGSFTLRLDRLNLQFSFSNQLIHNSFVSLVPRENRVV